MLVFLLSSSLFFSLGYFSYDYIYLKKQFEEVTAIDNYVDLKRQILIYKLLKNKSYDQLEVLTKTFLKGNLIMHNQLASTDSILTNEICPLIKSIDLISDADAELNVISKDILDKCQKTNK